MSVDIGCGSVCVVSSFRDGAEPNATFDSDLQFNDIGC